jgi:predicted transcriptional regulator
LLIETKKDSGNSHRGRLDIMADILEAAHNGTKKTYLMYRCNLSFRQLREYLEFMLRRGFLWTVNDINTDPSLYKITDKGKEFLKIYKNLKALMK